MQLAPWLQSSQDPTEVANKVKGMILAFSSIIILVATQLFGIHLSANDVISFSTEAGAVFGAIWTLWGAILHLVTWFGTAKNGTIQ